MPPLGIVSDLRVSLHAEPMRQRTVLLLLPRELQLDTESLLGRLNEKKEGREKKHMSDRRLL